jgi:hypothetical protein
MAELMAEQAGRCCHACCHVRLSGSRWLEEMVVLGFVSCDLLARERAWQVNSPGVAIHCRRFDDGLVGTTTATPPQNAPQAVLDSRPCDLFGEVLR